MKGFTEGIKVIDWQDSITLTVSLEDVYSKIALSTGSNQNIIVSLSITKIDDSGPITKSVKSNGGSDCNSAANFQGIKFGTGAVKFKNAVVQCCAISKCYLLIVIR